MPIEENLEFKPVRIAVLTISDSRSAAEDRSGDKLEELLTRAASAMQRDKHRRKTILTVANSPISTIGALR